MIPRELPTIIPMVAFISWTETGPKDKDKPFGSRLADFNADFKTTAPCAIRAPAAMMVATTTGTMSCEKGHSPADRHGPFGKKRHGTVLLPADDGGGDLALDPAFAVAGFHFGSFS